MPTLSQAQLLDWLAQNQFLTLAQAESLRSILANFPNMMAFVKELLRRDWLTAYQVNQIMQGKHDQLVIDNYRLRERLGEGAMGMVYKAWSLKLGYIVALKTLHKERAPNALTLQRFQREVAAASQLDHPNIAFVRDAGEFDGKPFMVMEYIEGFNLAARVKQRGPLPIADTVEYVRQAALGLQHALERNVVHRDIKPSNLMVTILRSVDGQEHSIVKVLDFGLARHDDGDDAVTRLTKVGSLLGTIDYIAPEQAHDARHADIRADIYSLGCTLFFLLTARPPFLGDTAIERIGQRLTGDPPWVRQARPDVPPVLEEILRKMMARRPEDRYQTPIEVAEALASLDPSQPTSAPSPGVRPSEPQGAPASEMPLTIPGVVLATPIATDAPAHGNVIMAMPIDTQVASEPILAAAIQPPLDAAAPFTPSPPSEEISATPPVRSIKKPFSLLKLLLFGGGAVALVSVCIGACAIGFVLRNSGETKKAGVMEITEVKLSVPDGTLVHQDHKFVLVKFSRSGFKGPVKLFLEDLPEHVVCTERIVQEAGRQGDIAIDVGTWAKVPMEHDIRVVAESEKEGVRAEKTLRIKIAAKRK